jgi:hypothetical protein
MSIGKTFWFLFLLFLLFLTHGLKTVPSPPVLSSFPPDEITGVGPTKNQCLEIYMDKFAIQEALGSDIEAWFLLLRLCASGRSCFDGLKLEKQCKKRRLSPFSGVVFPIIVCAYAGYPGPTPWISRREVV